MDKYEVLRIAGRGAYGTAYLARRKTDGREVILKQIPIEQMSSADRHSILTEIKVLSMLQHPNVIEYYENFLQDKAMIIVMEYAAGGTLFDLIEARRKEARYLEEDELAHLFAQIVLSMYYVHQNQILHRDLKSQNIFLTRSLDHVKIGDFGISKILSTKSKAFTVVGKVCCVYWLFSDILDHNICKVHHAIFHRNFAKVNKQNYFRNILSTQIISSSRKTLQHKI